MANLFKRKRQPHVYTPGQMLQTLAQLRLVALLQHSSIWLAVEPRIAWLLDVCCTGQREGGPGTALEVAAALQLGPTPPAPPQPAVTAAGSNGGSGEATSPSGPPSKRWCAAAPCQALADTEPSNPYSTALPSPARTSCPTPTTMELAAAAAETEAATAATEAVGPAAAAATIEQVPCALAVTCAAAAGIASDPCTAAIDASEGGASGTHVGRVQADKAPGIQTPASTPAQRDKLPAASTSQSDLTEQVTSHQACMDDVMQVQGTDQPTGPDPISERQPAHGTPGLHGPGQGPDQRGQQCQGRGGRGGGRAGGRQGQGQEEPWTQEDHVWVAVRLGLEEVFFLHHVLGCVQVVVAPGIDPGVQLGCGRGQERMEKGSMTGSPADLARVPMDPDCEPAAAAAAAAAATAGTADSAGSPGRLASSAAAGQEVAGGSSLVRLSTQELWEACCALRAGFPPSVAAYQHFKAKGWLPRSGLLYGVDWVLYPLHPKAAHSAFSVKIIPLLKEASGQGQGQEQGQAPHPESHSYFSRAHNHMAGVEELAWHDFQITSRVSGTVAKRLLLLYLCEANTSPGLHVHQCLEHMRVEERLVQRWVPDATRD